jgi:amino acid transporter
VLYGVLLFTGFESAANLGEETAQPGRDIPRAVLFAVLFVSGFYVICTYAQLAGYHFSLDALTKNAGAPLFGLAAPGSAGGFGSDLVRRLLEVVVILDMLAVLIGISVAGSRGLFAMGRDQRLPRALGRTSATGTPLVAGIVLLTVDVLTVAVTALWHGLFAQPAMPHYVAVFSWASTFGGFALTVIYLLLSLGALRGLRDHPKQWAVRLAVADGVVITLAAIFGSVYHVAAPTLWAPIAALAMLPIGWGLTYVFRGRAPLVSRFDAVPPAEQGPVKL